MSGNLDPRDDHPLAPGVAEPGFAEAQQWNITDGTNGVIAHIGSMPGDLKLWHCVMAVTRPDGTVYAVKIVGRGDADMFGTPTLHALTIDPYRRWRLSFDGAMRRYAPGELDRAPASDGVHVPVRVELDIEDAHPVWVLGGHKEEDEQGLFNRSFRFHHEQALRARGRIVIEGVEIAIEGIGHRDHSRGPRDMRTTRSHGWINGSFKSGWSFASIVGTMEQAGDFNVAAIFDDGRLEEGRISRWSPLDGLSAEPRRFDLEIDLPSGARTVRMDVGPGLIWSGVGTMEWCVGAAATEEGSYLYSHHFAAMECDGERGLGFVDRGGKYQALIGDRAEG